MSSRKFIFGAKKNRKLKIRMKHSNINKFISKRSLNEPDDSLEETLDLGDATNDVNYLLEEHITGENSNIKNESGDLDVNGIVSGLDSESSVENNTDCDNESNLGENESNLGENESNLGENESNLDDNKSNLGDSNIDCDPFGSIDTFEAVAGSAVQIDNNDEHEISGHRVANLNFVVNQLREISEHDECPFSDLKIEKEVRSGLDSKVIFRCSTCHQSFPVGLMSSAPMCINSTAVLATNMIGIGYSQLEKFASVIDVPVMCAENYKKLNDKIGKYWEETAIESMKQAADEERQAAIELGDVDDDGIPFTTVIVDGTYSKRAFNKNFTALSGVAAIVGAHTGKILWIGVRNKYCVICVRSANQNVLPAPHLCTKNYSGPSSEMEWQSILEGFKCSVEMYNLRYTKVVADGDSSTYQKLLEHKPYGDRHIIKHECRNHLRRNYRKQLEPATTGCPRGLRDHVTKSLGRIIKCINSATDYRSKEQNKTNAEKVALLKSDINNVIHHVFGDHQNCPSYIKHKCDELDENYIPALQSSGTYEKLAAPTRRLMYCASDLLLGFTNNPAEHYNSIVAMFVGGKRVNYSLSNSYGYKANAATVQFNEKTPLTTLYRNKFNTNPPILATKIQLKRLRKTEQDKERRKIRKENKIFPKKFCRQKEKGTGYGVREDLPALAFESEKKLFSEKLEKYQTDRVMIEQETRNKFRCTLWEEVSCKVLMASYFGLICKARSMIGHVKTISQGSYAQTKAMKHSAECQPVAIKQLSQEQKLDTLPCGLFIDKEHKCLAAAPTATAGTDMIVHVECPTSIFNKDPKDVSVLAKLPYIEMSEDNTTVLGLKKSDNIYYEIQGQLHICEKQICIFAIWTSTQHKMYTERIKRDETFFDTKMKDQLLSFYNDWLLPELVDPRLCRKMEIRVPESSNLSSV